MVELKGIRKYFSSNGVMALDGADFDLREGEIHALLGENGAGKSTLMHIMAGFIKPDAARKRSAVRKPGSIFVNGKEQRFSSPANALAEGIGMIRQHPHYVPGFLVWESCAVGSENHLSKKPSPWLNRRRCREQIAEVNNRFRFDLPLDEPTENLTVSQGQKAAILNLLLRDVRYFIFDEPTAVLTPAETHNLFELFTTLRDEGRGVVLISHKLEETLGIAGRVTVLRQGKTRVSCKTGELSSNALYAYIFGDNTAVEANAAGTARTSSTVELSSNTENQNTPEFLGIKEDQNALDVLGTPDFPALLLRDFTVNVPGRPLIRGINLDLPRGKIMGIAGVRDSGLETLELALTGFLPSSGTLQINGTDLSGSECAAGKNDGAKRGDECGGGRNSGRNGVFSAAKKVGVFNAAKKVKAFRAAGIAYLDTRNEGTMLPVRDLLIIHSHRRFQKRGILNQKEINGWIESLMTAAGISFNNRAAAGAFSAGTFFRGAFSRNTFSGNTFSAGAVPAGAFSGGQLQRLLLAREMAEQGVVLVLSDPGRGLDREYRKTLAAQLREKIAGGTAALIFSTTVEELLELSDTIAVLRDGIFSRVIELNSEDSRRRAPEIIREAMVGRT